MSEAEAEAEEAMNVERTVRLSRGQFYFGSCSHFIFERFEGFCQKSTSQSHKLKVRKSLILAYNEKRA